jgi:MarR family transcriptional regulator, 2-MHQ and catechol-resistance regulon repressor
VAWSLDVSGSAPYHLDVERFDIERCAPSSLEPPTTPPEGATVPTHYRGSDDERRALDVYIKLARAVASVDGAINRPLADAGLTTSQFGVLEALWHLGPLGHGAIGRKILKSSANVTTVIDNLCRLGLVTREADSADRRVRTVALTPAGREVVERVLPEHVRRVRSAFACLTPDEQETLGTLLRRVGLANAAATSTAA